MVARVTLRPGFYYAGFVRPFLATDGMIRSKLATYGIKDVQFHDRNDPDPSHPQTEPLPPVDPKLDKNYKDDWEEWISASYAGTPRTVDYPASIRWIVPGPRSDPKPAPPAKSSSSNAVWWILALYFLNKS
jgi:hypothetical protein